MGPLGKYDTYLAKKEIWLVNLSIRNKNDILLYQSEEQIITDNGYFFIKLRNLISIQDAFHIQMKLQNANRSISEQIDFK